LARGKDRSFDQSDLKCRRADSPADAYADLDVAADAYDLANQDINSVAYAVTVSHTCRGMAIFEFLGRCFQRPELLERWLQDEEALWITGK